MRIPRIICLIYVGMAMLASVSVAEVIQSAGQDGSLWMERDGAEIGVEMPPGATLRDLEPTSDGWLAAGRLPTTEGTDLLIVSSDAEGTDLLPVPNRGRGRLRGQPVLLLDRQELVGLAWAEGNGPRELEIWAAAWLDGKWGPSELVSPKGPGSQVAPVGTVLEDGSWLLVWAAYDGQDDEIVASRRVDGFWTHPQPIHQANEVPDLTPDVSPIQGGALVVWSWYDGNDYRLKSARWLDGGWHEGGAFGGKGSGEPRLIHGDERILLLYQAVEPASWTVLEMDLAGSELRSAVVLLKINERPLLLLSGQGEDRLRWSIGDRALEWSNQP